MSRPVYTNSLCLHVDEKAVDKKFDAWMIRTDLKGKKNYGRVINAIYKHVKPLSISRCPDGYVALTFKGAQPKINDPHFALVPQSVSDLPEMTCARLLINAMPYLHSDDHCSGGAGLFYMKDIQSIGQVEVIRAFEIKLQQIGRRDLLQINGVTFTPVSYHTDSKGDVYQDCRHLPRFKFDKWSQRITRNRSGEFFQKKHRDEKMKSEMVSLNTKDPSRFLKSKMGVLVRFLEDVDRQLGGMLVVELKKINPNYRGRFKERKINAHYQKIDGVLRNKNINIVNLTDAPLDALKSALADDGIPYSVSSEIKKDSLNLVIHHGSDFYKKRKSSDPYRALHTNGSVVQSSYPETLIGEKGLARSEYESCKKELLIKHEVHQRQLLLVVPDGEWMFILVEKKEDKGDSQSLQYNVLNVCNGLMDFKVVDGLDNSLDEFLVELPRVPKPGDRVVIARDSGQGFIFSETGMVAIPEFQSLSLIMQELQEGYDTGIPRIWIEEFVQLLVSGGVVVKRPEELKKRLDTVLLATQYDETVGSDVLIKNKETRLTYRGGQQAFFDWVYRVKGVRLAASLKSADAGFLEASLGLFYNEEEKLFFVGDKDNVKSIPRFSVIRHIESDFAVPVELLSMMEVFHIRHRQPTVYPFLFKHLAEWQRQQQVCEKQNTSNEKPS